MTKVRVGFLAVLGLGILGVLLPAETSRAATSTWKGTGTGNWNVSGNWLGGIPTNTAIAVINNSGTATLPTGFRAHIAFCTPARPMAPQARSASPADYSQERAPFWGLFPAGAGRWR